MRYADRVNASTSTSKKLEFGACRRQQSAAICVSVERLQIVFWDIIMQAYTRQEARQFAERWLPAWSGNEPERLAAFYADDAFYLDPGIPDGVQGKPALLTYFRKLLAYNPNWRWRQLEGIPMQDGFLNKWQADIPVSGSCLSIVGVCLVQLNAAGLIRRNEVYFDRSALLAAIAAHRAKQ